MALAAAARAPLEAENKALREALEVFARVYKMNEPIAASWSDDLPARDFLPHFWPTWKDFKIARQALATTDPKTDGEGEISESEVMPNELERETLSSGNDSPKFNPPGDPPNLSH